LYNTNPVLVIGASENMGKELRFVCPEVTSLKNGFDKIPDFNFKFLTKRKLLLNSNSCFSEKSVFEAACFIVKYSSCNDEL
jgi:hypothetical protein